MSNERNNFLKIKSDLRNAEKQTQVIKSFKSVEQASQGTKVN